MPISFGQQQQFDPTGGIVNVNSLVQQLLSKRIAGKRDTEETKAANAQAEGAFNLLRDEFLERSKAPRSGDTPDTIVASYIEQADRIAAEINDPTAKQRFQNLFVKQGATNAFEMRSNLQGVFNANVIKEAKIMGNEVVSGSDPTSYPFRLAALRNSRDAQLALVDNPGPVLNQYKTNERTLVDNTISTSLVQKGREKTYVDMLPPVPGFAGGAGYQQLKKDGIRQETIDAISKTAIGELKGVYSTRYSDESVKNFMGQKLSEQAKAVQSIAGLDWALENMGNRADLMRTRLMLDKPRMLASGITESQFNNYKARIKREENKSLEKGRMLSRGYGVLVNGERSFGARNKEDVASINMVARLIANDSIQGLDAILRSDAPAHEKAMRMQLAGVNLQDKIKSHTRSAGFLPEAWSEHITSMWNSQDAELKRFSSELVSEIFGDGGDSTLRSAFSGKLGSDVLGQMIYAHEQSKNPGVSWSTALNATKEKYDGITSQSEKVWNEGKDKIKTGNVEFLAARIHGGDEPQSPGERAALSVFTESMRSNFLMHDDLDVARAVTWGEMEKTWGEDAHGNFIHMPISKVAGEDVARDSVNLDLAANGYDLEYDDVHPRFIGNDKDKGPTYTVWAEKDGFLQALTIKDENGSPTTNWYVDTQLGIEEADPQASTADDPDNIVTYNGARYDLNKHVRDGRGKLNSVRDILDDVFSKDERTARMNFLHDINTIKTINSMPLERLMDHYSGSQLAEEMMMVGTRGDSLIKDLDAVQLERVKSGVNPDPNQASEAILRKIQGL